MKPSKLLLILWAMVFFIPASFGQVRDRASRQDIARPSGLPEIGKWMLDSQLQPASWLRQKYHGNDLREPINLILVDELAASSEEATNRLIENCVKAGFKIRRGHSSGYFGYIAGSLYKQIPEEKDHAFSDGPFEMSNNHGRIFGPHAYGKKFYFIGAFSREILDPLKKVKHQYGSFNRARDHFSEKMNVLSNYRISGFINLDNAIPNDPHVTTGDHDGMAALLRAAK